MDPNQAYSAAEVERMMKLQDILLKAMAGKMRWWEADETISVRYEPHVVGRNDRNGDPLPKPETRGKDPKQDARLGNLAPPPRLLRFLFPSQNSQNRGTGRHDESGQITC